MEEQKEILFAREIKNSLKKDKIDDKMKDRICEMVNTVSKEKITQKAKKIVRYLWPVEICVLIILGTLLFLTTYLEFHHQSDGKTTKSDLSIILFSLFFILFNSTSFVAFYVLKAPTQLPITNNKSKTTTQLMISFPRIEKLAFIYVVSIFSFIVDCAAIIYFHIGYEDVIGDLPQWFNVLLGGLLIPIIFNLANTLISSTKAYYLRFNIASNFMNRSCMLDDLLISKIEINDEGGFGFVKEYELATRGNVFRSTLYDKNNHEENLFIFDWLNKKWKAYILLTSLLPIYQGKEAKKKVAQLLNRKQKRKVVHLIKELQIIFTDLFSSQDPTLNDWDKWQRQK